MKAVSRLGHFKKTGDVDIDVSYRTRTNTNPNDTEANAAGRSIRACVARKSKTQTEECLEGRKLNTSIPSKVETVHQIILKPDLGRFCGTEVELISA